MSDMIAALANRFWRIHPREIQDLGITREQFYEREMRALFTTQATARIEQLEARLDRAVTRGLEQVEHIATLEEALRKISITIHRDYDEEPVLALIKNIADAALAPETEK
jgi:hypothetical protein